MDRWIPNLCASIFVANPNPSLTLSAFIDEDTKIWILDLVSAFALLRMLRTSLNLGYHFQGMIDLSVHTPKMISYLLSLHTKSFLVRLIT